MVRSLPTCFQQTAPGSSLCPSPLEGNPSRAHLSGPQWRGLVMRLVLKQGTQGSPVAMSNFRGCQATMGCGKHRGRTNACFSEWSWNLHPGTYTQHLPTCDGCWWLCVCAQGHPPGPLHLEGGSRDRALGGLVLRGQSLRTSRETGAGNGAFRGLAQHAPQASGARPPRSRVHSLPRAFVQGLRRSPCSASGDARAAGTQRRLWPRPEAARGQTERRGVARQVRASVLAPGFLHRGRPRAAGSGGRALRHPARVVLFYRNVVFSLTTSQLPRGIHVH